MILVLTVSRSFCSQDNYKIYVTKDFQCEYFIYQDPMCDLNVPLGFFFEQRTFKGKLT